MKLKFFFISITGVLLISLLFACNQQEQKNVEVAEGEESTRLFEPATGWIKGGNDPNSYEMGIDKGAGRNGAAATIKSSAKNIDGFATLSQEFLPDNFREKRIRMTAYLKTKNVDNWASLWMRIDQENADEAPLKNMADRVVKGTTDWTKYDIVLDVPAKATNIAFGCLLSGTGQLWLDDITFEVVSDSVPITTEGARYKRERQPINLDFEQ